MPELTFQQKNVIDLMKDHLKSLEDASKSLDDKAQQNISVSSIIIAIISVFKLGEITNPPQLIFTDQSYIFSIFLIYVLIFGFSYAARFPRKFATHPLEPTWEKAQSWLGLHQEKYYDNLLAAYTDIIERNKNIIDIKATFVKVASILIGLDIALIFLAAFT